MPLDPSDDAFGAALADHLAGRRGPELVLELDDGYTAPAMPPAAFFLPPGSWARHERRAIEALPPGPVLDLGAGAGRHAVHLQERGHHVTAVDISPGAVDVCRARGVRDVRLAELTEVPDDHRWAAVLLLCGNLGLPGDWDGTRALLARLAAVAAPGAALVADTVDPDRMGDEHATAYRRHREAAGRPPGQIRLRLRYGPRLTPWWNLLTVAVDDAARLVDGTGWVLEDHVDAGIDHQMVLRRP